MEMHQLDFQSVNMSASNELQLSSSSSTSTSSSSLTSPANNSSMSSPPIPSPPPPPPPPPPHLQAEQHCTISIPSAPAVLSPRGHYLTKEKALKSLRESIPHSMRLAQLLKSDRVHQKDASWNKKAVRRLSKDLYMIVSMYALLQGALFTAVAQSSIFTCADLWGPACIVGAITVGTVSAAVNKLRRMQHHKKEVKKFERRQSAVYDKIAVLYWRGSLCEIESLEPEHGDTFEESQCMFSAHGVLVLGFLLGFSALMMLSCARMLCRPCHCVHIA